MCTMKDGFKIYYTDKIDGKEAAALPPGAIPIALDTEKAAFDFALRALALDRTVWKIERPNGEIITREQIDAIYRAMPKDAVR